MKIAYFALLALILFTPTLAAAATSSTARVDVAFVPCSVETITIQIHSAHYNAEQTGKTGVVFIADFVMPVHTTFSISVIYTGHNLTVSPFNSGSGTAIKRIAFYQSC